MPIETPVYRLRTPDGRVSWIVPSLAGAYRLAEKVRNLPYGTVVERGFQGEWQRIGPRPLGFQEHD